LEKQINITEKNLIRELKNGSSRAFDKIYQMYSKRLYAYSVQFTKSSEEAEEIIQDVFVKLWQNRANIRQEETLRSLLFIMAKHHLINAYHSKVNHPVYEEYVNHLDVLMVDNAHYQIEYDEFVLKFSKELKKLPPTQQKVITLSRFEQLTNKEVAEKLMISEQTVKNQLSIGLKALREKLVVLLIFLSLFLFK